MKSIRPSTRITPATQPARRPLALRLGLALGLLALGGCGTLQQSSAAALSSPQTEGASEASAATGKGTPGTTAGASGTSTTPGQASPAGANQTQGPRPGQNGAPDGSQQAATQQTSGNGQPTASGPEDGASQEGTPAQARQPSDDTNTVMPDEGIDPGAVPAPYRPANLPELALTPPLMYQILAAEMALQARDLDGAYNTFQSLAAQTGDARLARRATEVGIVAGALPEALASARLWARLDPTLPEARRALDALLLANGRVAEAEPSLTRELKAARQQQTLDTAYPALQEKLLNLPDRQAAWALIQRLSAPDLNSVAARLARARIAFEAGKREAAADEALAAHQLAPNDIEAVLASVQLLQPLPGGRQRAAALLDEYLKNHPNDLRALKAQGLLQIASEQNHAAITTLNKVQSQEPDNPVTLYTLAQLHFQQRNYAAATSSLKRYLALPADPQRDPGNAWLFLAEIAQAQADLPAAIEALESVPPTSRQHFEAQVLRATLLARQQHRPEAGMAALQGLKPASEEQRQMVVVARAQILRHAKRFHEAYRLLDKALKTQKDPTDLLYDHAVAAEGIGRFDIAEKDLRRLIKARPDEANAYNALGYMLADRNVRLPEALELIEKANRLLPDNPHILDSLGWVYFRTGRIDDAIAIFQKIWLRLPEAELGTHYGEVLWAKGNREAARAVWRETQKIDPDNKLLRDTLQRLDVKL